CARERETAQASAWFAYW
nr:immunoglobulin heavy chain junction region [Mus musculus]